MTSEVNELKRAFDAYKHRRQRAELEAKQREDLLSRRFVPNSAEAILFRLITVNNTTHNLKM